MTLEEKIIVNFLANTIGAANTPSARRAFLTLTHEKIDEPPKGGESFSGNLYERACIYNKDLMIAEAFGITGTRLRELHEQVRHGVEPCAPAKALKYAAVTELGNAALTELDLIIADINTLLASCNDPKDEDKLKDLRLESKREAKDIKMGIAAALTRLGIADIDYKDIEPNSEKLGFNRSLAENNLKDYDPQIKTYADALEAIRSRMRARTQTRLAEIAEEKRKLREAFNRLRDEEDRLNGDK